MKVIIVLALIAITKAHPTDLKQDDVGTRAYENELRALMEKIRAIMPDGIPSLGLPPLEPLKMDKINLNLNMPDILLLEAVFETFKVEGIQKFIINSINFDVKITALKFNADITIDKLSISAAHYYLNAIIDNGFLEIYGEGKAGIEISDLNIIVVANMAIKGGKVVVTQMSVLLSIRKVKSDLGGLMGGGAASEIMNEVVGDFLPAVIEHEQETLSNYIGKKGTEFANKLLKDMSLVDLINIITGNKPFP